MDEQINRMQKDLSVLFKKLLEFKEPEQEYSITQRVARDYLLQNESLLNVAAQAFEKLSSQDRSVLAQRHNLTLSVSGASVDSLYGALRNASYKSWDTDETLAYFELSMFEELPRVLSYSKFLTESSGYALKMSPVFQYLPRKLMKEARLEKRADKATLTIGVRGGLKAENREAFESIRFTSGLDLERAAEEEYAIANLSGSKEVDQIDMPFRVTLSCPLSATTQVESILKSHGFNIRNQSLGK